MDGPVPGTSPEVDTGAQLRRVLASARKNRARIVLLGLLGLLLGGLVASFIPDMYESRTLLEVRQRELIEDSRLLKAINEKPLIQKEETLENELLSYQWIHDVLKDLGWPDVYGRIKDDPAAVYELIHKIQVDKNFQVSMNTVISGSLLVELKFIWDDPRKARQFVERARRNWIQRRDDEYRRDFERQLAALERVVDDRKRVYQTARRALEKFETDNQITAYTDQNADVLLRSQLTLDRSATRSQIEELEPQLQELEKTIEQTPKTVETTTNIPNSDYETRKQAYDQELAALELLRSEKKLTDKHPDVKAQLLKLEAAKKALAEVKDNVFSKASVQQQVNEAYTDLQKRVNELRGQVTGLKAKLADLDVQLADVQSRVDRLPLLLSARASLANEVEQAERSLNEALTAIAPLRDKVDVMNRRNAVVLGNAERSLQESGAIAILEDPVEPKKPIGIPKPVIALIGLIVGIAIGLAYALISEMARSTFTSAVEVSDVLRIPVLGAVGRIVTPAEARRERLRSVVQGIGTTLVLVALVGMIWMMTMQPEQLPLPLQKGLESVRTLFK